MRNIGRKLFVLIILAFKTGLLSSSLNEKQNKNPNIIVIFADDMGYGDVSALNLEAKTHTPAINEMAESGIVFTEAHSSASVCTPSRYGLLTGSYAFRNRLKGGNVGGYDASVLGLKQNTIAHLLKNAGYTTACIGKWHLGFEWATRNQNEKPSLDQLSKYSNVDYSKPIKFGPNYYGFDYSFIHPASLDIPPYLFLKNGLAVDKQMILTSDVYPKSLETTQHSWDKKHTAEGDIYWKKGVWWRDGEMAKSFKIEKCLGNIMDEAVDFLRQKALKENPFFLYLPLTGPHTPWVPDDQFKGKSSIDTYGDFILTIDNVVKVINEEVNKLGIANNTMIIFTSDNGGYWPEEEIILQNHHSNYGRRGQKGDIWDGGHHVPLIIKWPARISKPKNYTHLVSLTDLFATFSDLTGQKIKGGDDSFSFNHVLNGNFSKPTRNSMIHCTGQKFFAIRKGNWKYIDMVGSGGFTNPTQIQPKPGEPDGQLYNIKSDPFESNNLYFKYPSVVADLKLQIKRAKESSTTTELNN
jgi:arylsulfatase A-like enzyme